jgi:hypothetical protein
MTHMQQQYWPQAYAQQYAQQQPQQAYYAAPNYGNTASAGAGAGAYAQPTAQPTYAQMPYAQMQQMQQYYPQQAAAAYQPGFRAAGGYDYSDYHHGSAFDTRSAGKESRTAGRSLPPKAVAWRNKVVDYSEHHGISLKEAMIRLKGTGTGSRTSRSKHSHGSR